MRMERPFDVVVVGGGVAGLSALYHLQRLGVQRLALAVAAEESSTSSLAAGLISGGQVDNFTRQVQAHGEQRAAAFWRFGDLAYDAVVAYAQAAGLTVRSGGRLRLLVSDHEVKEGQQAVAQLGQAQLAGALQSPAAARHGSLLLKRVLSVQDDGPRGAWIDPPSLLASLTQATAQQPRLGRVLTIAGRGGSKQLQLASGATATAEMVIATAHLGLRSLIPEIASALVPVADQWSEVALSGIAEDLSGLVYTANNTYEWGVFTGPQSLRFGGGRYLRPMAGIEAAEATVEARICAHLSEQLAQTWAFQCQLGPSRASLDISPCDELPIIGPLFGDGRILLATGFMGAGLTQGFFAGACLAELVARGSAPDLPRFLWPERLRSLPTT